MPDIALAALARKLGCRTQPRSGASPMKRTPLHRRTPLQARQSLRRSRWLRARPSGRRILDLAVREALRRRARERCERCGTSKPPHEAHHKHLRSQGGSDALDNLAYLCRRCHRWAHDNPQAACEEGWIIQRHRARLPEKGGA